MQSKPTQQLSDAETNPLSSLDVWEDDLLERYPDPESIAKGKTTEEYRNYETPGRDSVREFYRLNHTYQTYEFVQQKRADYLKFDKKEMSVWDAFNFLNELVDDSDPDTDLDQFQHLLQQAIARAANTVRAVSHGYSGVAAGAPPRSNVKLYTDIDPLQTAGFEKKVKLLEEMNAYARGLDSRVRQVSASLSGEWQRIEILRAGGEHYSDIRPLVRLNVSVIVEENGRQESGVFGGGGADFRRRYSAIPSSHRRGGPIRASRSRRSGNASLAVPTYLSRARKDSDSAPRVKPLAI